MANATGYTLDEIRAAFWKTFHKRGELWFDYLGTEEENTSCTEDFWGDFSDNLDQLDPLEE